jgi:hypothetical protein
MRSKPIQHDNPGEKSMAAQSLEDSVVADVKCYFCGHISGQIISRRSSGNGRSGRFVPRPGYRGAEVKPGHRIRCERCMGPVFLEDATPMARAEGALARTLRVKAGEAKRPSKAA